MVYYEQLIEILWGLNYAHENTRPGYITASTKLPWATVIQSEKEHISFIIHISLQLISQFASNRMYRINVHSLYRLHSSGSRIWLRGGPKFLLAYIADVAK